MPIFMVDLAATEISEIEKTILKHPNVGAIILFTRNFASPAQLKKLIHDVHTINPDLFIAVDHEGGFVQRFVDDGFRALPAARVYGDVYDLNHEAGISLARNFGKIMAEELIAYGIDLSLAPVLDVHGDSKVIAGLDRAFHKDPEVVALLAGTFIEGMHAAGMPSCAKHYPGHGSVVLDSHVDKPILSATMEQLKARDLKPFTLLMQQGLLDAVMPAHVNYTAGDEFTPAGFSKFWLKDVLRTQCKFNGFVLSDCLSMKGADIGDMVTRAKTALEAGCNMIIVCHQERPTLLDTLNAVKIAQNAESLQHLATFKAKMVRFKKSHSDLNQNNYDKKATEHSTLSLNSTLYLAYRDVNDLLTRHLYPYITNNTIRMLDFGCGTGLSMQIISQTIQQNHSGCLQITGVDINAGNLEIAKQKLPQAQFKIIKKGESLENLGHFDLIICNFVLVEIQEHDMLTVLTELRSRLSKNGILIVTNPTARVYRTENNWNSLNTQFPENAPTRKSDTHTKLKFHEDQPIKIQVFSASNSDQSFTFHDFFHSGTAYKKAYTTAGLQLVETHKPIGQPDDQITWQSESAIPPFKQHVLKSN